MSQAPTPLEAPLPDPNGAAPTKEPTRWTGWDLLMVFLTSIAFGILVVAALLLALRAAGVELSNTITIGIASVAIYGAVLISGWLFAIKRRGATLEEVGFKWVGVGPLLLAIPVVIGLMIVTFVILTGIELLFGGVPTAREQVVPDRSSLVPADLFWLLLAGSVAAPIAEEFFFRGLLFRYLRGRSSLRAAVLWSSALFAVFHFTPALMPALFVFGIVQALLVHRFDSLYPAILLHALNNGVLLIGVYVSLS